MASARALELSDGKINLNTKLETLSESKDLLRKKTVGKTKGSKPGKSRRKR